MAARPGSARRTLAPRACHARDARGDRRGRGERRRRRTVRRPKRISATGCRPAALARGRGSAVARIGQSGHARLAGGASARRIRPAACSAAPQRRRGTRRRRRPACSIAMLDGGGRAAGQPRWGLVAGARADLVVADPDDEALRDVPADRRLDAMVFVSPSRPVPGRVRRRCAGLHRQRVSQPPALVLYHCS